MVLLNRYLQIVGTTDSPNIVCHQRHKTGTLYDSEVKPSYLNQKRSNKRGYVFERTVPLLSDLSVYLSDLYHQLVLQSNILYTLRPNDVTENRILAHNHPQ